MLKAVKLLCGRTSKEGSRGSPLTWITACDLHAKQFSKAYHQDGEFFSRSE